MPIEDPRKLTFPFGREDVYTLVVGINEEHIRKLIQAFQMKAEYRYGIPALAGRGYKKIIYFINRDGSERHLRAQQDYMKEYLPTKLYPGGVLVII